MVFTASSCIMITVASFLDTYHWPVFSLRATIKKTKIPSSKSKSTATQSPSLGLNIISLQNLKRMIFYQNLHLFQHLTLVKLRDLSQ